MERDGTPPPDQPAREGAAAPTRPRVLVVKLGGASGIDPDPVLRDLAAHDGPWILVHGGNQELDAVSRRMGVEPRFVHSPSGHTSRLTDDETLGLIQMVYRGRINNDLVLRLQRLGVAAVGLSGADGGLWQARIKDAIRAVTDDGRRILVRGDRTGRIHTVDPRLLELLLANGYRPVLTLPALADDGGAVNVDGDRAAAAVAAAVGASDLVVLSNVPGLLRDVDDQESLITRIPRDAIDDADRFAKGRMKRKLVAAREALEGGVDRVVLATTHSEHPVQDALAGKGTVVQ